MRRAPVLSRHRPRHPARQAGAHIADADTLWLIDRILASGAGVLAPMYEMEWFPGDDLLAPLRPRGLPVGNLTSQTWANIYLDSLDQFVKRELKCPAYVRYCDDFLLFRRRQGASFTAGRTRCRSIWTTLRLCLNWRRSVVYPVTTGIPFWVFASFPPPSPARRQRAPGASRLRRNRDAFQAGQHDREPVPPVAQAPGSPTPRHADSYRLRRALLSDIVLGLCTREECVNLESTMAHSSIEFPIFPLFADFMAWLTAGNREVSPLSALHPGQPLVGYRLLLPTGPDRARKVKGGPRPMRCSAPTWNWRCCACSCDWRTSCAA